MGNIPDAPDITCAPHRIPGRGERWVRCCPLCEEPMSRYMYDTEDGVVCVDCFKSWVAELVNAEPQTVARLMDIDTEVYDGDI